MATLDSDAGIARRLLDVLGAVPDEKARTRPATVSRVDADGTVWVRMLGADGDTPVGQSAVTVEAGDTVAVTIANGRATLDANVSSPVTSTSYVEAVRDGLASDVVEVDQRITRVQGDLITAVNAASGWETMIREYGDGVLVCREGNAVGALVNADGSFDVVTVEWDDDGVPTAVVPLVSEGADALKFYDAQGVLMKNILAWFGADFTRMGRVEDMHVMIDDSGFEVANGPDSFMKVEGSETGYAATVTALDGSQYTYWALDRQDSGGPMGAYREYGSGDLLHDGSIAEEVANGHYDLVHVQPGDPEWVYVDVPIGEPEPYLYIYTDGNVAGAWMRMEDVEATGSTAGALYNYITGEITHGDDSPEVGWGHQTTDTWGSGVVPEGYTRSWFRLDMLSEFSHYQWVICSPYRKRDGSVTVGNTGSKHVVIDEDGLSLRQYVVVNGEPSSYLDITALDTSGAVISASKADPLILNPSILRLEADGTYLDINDEMVTASGHIQDGYGNLLARKLDKADAVTGVKGAAEASYRDRKSVV